MIKVLENEGEFDGELKNGNVLVDFNATWCGPCRLMGQILKNIEGDYPKITFLKVDIDKFPELANKYQIASIPNMLFFKDGEKIQVKLGSGSDSRDALVGSLPEDEFKDVLDNTFGK